MLAGHNFCISKLLPTTYTRLLNQATETAAIQLVDQLTAYNSFSDCEVALSEFSKETNAVFWVEDQNGSVIYPAGISTETEIISGDTAITFDEDEPLIDVTSSGKTSTSFYPVMLKDGSTYTLVVQVDLLVVQQTAEVLWSIFPYVILMILLCHFYAH